MNIHHLPSHVLESTHLQFTPVARTHQSSTMFRAIQKLFSARVHQPSPYGKEDVNQNIPKHVTMAILAFKDHYEVGLEIKEFHKVANK